MREVLFGKRSEGAAHPAGNTPDAPESGAAVSLEGAQRGWLRVLPAAELLSALKAHDALDAIWRQSRLSQEVWQRDLLPGIENMAELVQLMPASEAHHHAHAGGLLAHTLEMTLAALTWRNGRLLPEGATIEQIDRERDQWTYAVFFASLLHDIAKPMTDLNITWRATGMPQPLQWTPFSGSLVQVTQGWKGAEYHVDFAPKSQRDYGAHSRLALTLFPMIAPESARALLSRTPGALQALVKYLGGQDKASLLARTVIDADRRSVANALSRGSRARFETAASVPLIELLMQALRDMLKSGALPLNRNGAAGWVYDGCLWLVSKRAADSARAWIHEHAPEESVPGESKNDRLFDTWQEYGRIKPNPQTGQAIWYVRILGTAPGDGEGGEGAATYSHEFAVLCFALDKLYDDASQYPSEMNGRIEIMDKRGGKSREEAQSRKPREARQTAGAEKREHGGSVQDDAPPWEEEPAKEQGEDVPENLLDEDDTAASLVPKDVVPVDASKKREKVTRKPPPAPMKLPGLDDDSGMLRAPTFNRPKPKHVPVSAAGGQQEGKKEDKGKGVRDAHEEKAEKAKAAIAVHTIEAGGAAPRTQEGKKPLEKPKGKGAAQKQQRREDVPVPAPRARKDAALPAASKPVPLRREREDEGEGILLPDVPDVLLASGDAITIGMPEGFFDDGFDADDDEAPEFLDDKDSARAAAKADKAKVHGSDGDEDKDADEDVEEEDVPVPVTRPSKAAPVQRQTAPKGVQQKKPSISRAASAPAGDTAKPSQPQTRRMFTAPTPVMLVPELPELPMAEKRAEPSEAAIAFMQWLQQGLAGRVLKYNETGAPVHFVPEGMALISPAIFKLYAEEAGLGDDPFALQREVIRAGWHRVQKLGAGKGQTNILRYEVMRGGRVVSRLSAVVLADADRWVQPLPPANPVLRLAGVGDDAEGA
ncbi:MAG: TraI domain-containing protein [Actinomycetaceae bacterium]|nr:TraI domain-containing protein [Actinomycetaceae bacterium]